MNTKAIFILLTIAYVFNVNSYAISKDIHESVTQKAIVAYQDCTKQLGVNDSLTDGVITIAKATKWEDEWPLLSRYFNWHFYDAYKDDKEHSMKLSATGARKSLHYIYNDRADSLVDALHNKTKEDIFEYTGRLIHYVQDMTVPAHVAPIYHYKFLYLDESDYFDEMTEWKTSSFTADSNTCKFETTDIDKLKEQLNTILDNTAKKTRKRIASTIDVTKEHALYKKTWEVFWPLRKSIDDSTYKNTKSGFSQYSVEQGREGFRKLCEVDDINKTICMKFFMKSFNTTISSTVEMLLLINSINNNTTK